MKFENQRILCIGRKSRIRKVGTRLSSGTAGSPPVRSCQLPDNPGMRTHSFNCLLQAVARFAGRKAAGRSYRTRTNNSRTSDEQPPLRRSPKCFVAEPCEMGLEPFENVPTSPIFPFSAVGEFSAGSRSTPPARTGTATRTRFTLGSPAAHTNPTRKRGDRLCIRSCLGQRPSLARSYFPVVFERELREQPCWLQRSTGMQRLPNKARALCENTDDSNEVNGQRTNDDCNTNHAADFNGQRAWNVCRTKPRHFAKALPVGRARPDATKKLRVTTTTPLITKSRPPKRTQERRRLTTDIRQRTKDK